MSIRADRLFLNRDSQIGETHKRIRGPTAGDIVVSGDGVQDGERPVILKAIDVLIQRIDALMIEADLAAAKIRLILLISEVEPDISATFSGVYPLICSTSLSKPTVYFSTNSFL
jgi:hypothetical protein